MSGPLLGVSEIADLFGVSPQRADQLTRRDDFPEPVAALRAGRVWNKADVLDWGHRTGRFPDNHEG